MSKMMNRWWRKGKVWRNDCSTPLIGNNNNIKDACDQEVSGNNNPLAQNTFNIHQEQHLQPKENISPQQLVKLLEIQPGAASSTSDQDCRCLIQTYVSQRFPGPPADPNRDLQEHLLNVQNTVVSELTRLRPTLEPAGLIGCLIECYHHHTCEHLHSLLQNISSSKNHLVLLSWGLKTYLSQDMLGHPDLLKLDAIKKADMLLFTEWNSKAKEKLLENLQKELRESLEKILQFETQKEGCYSEEDYVGPYVYTIQCIDAVPTEARKISLRLSIEVQEVCFQQLLTFVRRYTTVQTELLRKKAKLDEPETMHFFKTLKTCKELKEYIKVKGTGTSLCEEAVRILQDMEGFTLELLMDVVVDIAETHLKPYFSTENKQFLLLDAMKKHFPNLLQCEDVQKTVMDKAYRVIVGLYVDHLIITNQSKLRKCWSPHVGPKVAQDASLLHCTISDLAPGVQPWNLMLLKITEVLQSNDIDGLKVIVAGMQKESLTKSEDPKFLCKLLRWKGLSKWQVREVLDALPPDYQPRARSGSWHTCLTCW